MEYLLTDSGVANPHAHVRSGGHLVITYFPGSVDENDHIRPGSFPGAFSELLGVQMEEFFPLRAGDGLELSRFGDASFWSELGQPTTAEVLAEVVRGPVLGVLCEDAGVEPLLRNLPEDVEVARRSKDSTDWTFFINHSSEGVQLPVSGLELISGQDLGGAPDLGAGAVAVVRSPINPSVTS
ncbi:beta-galactosidase trimerization domain-containing protein [Pseudarthrobacter sp. N5]|uniref:beta-galactosidase trimerization domain-containing protein n=1 Tax=Pseudarthrobacter sp. N5 TaxID=3418416 RepID=UPI003CECB7E8